MDPVTHALAGAAIARTGFQEKLGPKCATLTGILASQAPDLDVIAFALDPEGSVLVHRGISHSLVGIVVGTFLVTLVVRLFARKAPLRPLVQLVALGFASHVLLDAATSGGVALLSPFNDERMALSWLFIIDLVLILLLLIPWFLRKTMDEVRAFRALLVVSGLYLASCGFAHGVAEASLELTLDHHQIKADARYVLPAPFAPLSWNAIAFDDKNYYQLNLNLPHVPENFSHTGPHNLRHPAVDALRRSDAGRPVFGRFRAPIATVEKLAVDHVRITIDDARFYHWLSQRWGARYYRFSIEMKRNAAGRWKNDGPGSFRTDYEDDEP